MAFPVIMPKTGMAMEEGTVLRWLKKEGEAVAKGEILLEIETDKASMEVEAEATGQLLKILRQEGEVVPVTQTIAWIGQPGEPLIERVPARDAPSASAAAPASTAVPPTAGVTAGPAALEPPPVREPWGKVPATPATKRQAAARGLLLQAVTGSGPYGAVRLRDLAPYATGPAEALAAVQAGRRQPLSGQRKTIAEKMIRSWQVPAPTLLARANVTDLTETRRMLNEGQEIRVSITDLVIKAVAVALREHPLLNSSILDGEIVYHDRINIGLAVALEDGLVVPVVHGADGLGLLRLAERTRDLAARARERRLSREETTGGTFTVSNLGMYGITSFSPLINVPESAILGVGAIEEVLRLGAERQPESRRVMELCLTHDHRHIDGAQAAQFLGRVRLLLENPYALLML
jgi:pyruvate dehydrogenase E2 component (dihydrolipoamide acetyltransferase)